MTGRLCRSRDTPIETSRGPYSDYEGMKGGRRRTGPGAGVSRYVHSRGRCRPTPPAGLQSTAHDVKPVACSIAMLWIRPGASVERIEAERCVHRDPLVKKSPGKPLGNDVDSDPPATAVCDFFPVLVLASVEVALCHFDQLEQYTTARVPATPSRV